MFCGVLMEASRWITQCRLNKIKDTDGNWADVCWREERGVWYHSLQRKEGCGIVQKLNPLGRFNSQSCLVRTRRHFASLRNCQGPCREQQQLCSLHKNLHRPAVPQYPSNIFYSYFVFSPFVFDDLLAAMKSSSSRVELSSSCSSFFIRRLSSSRISKKPTWKSGISASEFCSFSWNVLQIFLRETFWRSKEKTFEFCGPYSEMRPAYNAHSDLVMDIWV